MTITKSYYLVSLINTQVLFDSEEFDSILTAVKWAEGRGECRVVIDVIDGNGFDGNGCEVSYFLSGNDPRSKGYAEVVIDVYESARMTRRELVKHIEGRLAE